MNQKNNTDVIVDTLAWPEKTMEIEKRNFFGKNALLKSLIGNHNFKSIDDGLKSMG